MKSVTLKDVAAAAGVSVSTVSRVLDERLPASKSPSAQRVRQVAAELGYRRHPAASALRRGDTGTVGVLVPRLTDTVMALLFEALYARAAARGFFALVSVCGDDPDEEQHAVDSLLARRVDGLILATARLGDTLPKTLRENGVPHVLALRSDGVSPSSVCDDELGGYLATRHLIDLGHRRIGILPGPDFASTAHRRLAGFRRAMSEANLAVIEDNVRHSGFGFHAGYDTAEAMITDDPSITAVFAANDRLAMGAVSAAAHLSRPVPDSLSIVGYNDIPVSSQPAVPLTTVRVPFDQIAANALDLLLAQTQGSSFEAATSRTSLPSLIPRRSTKQKRDTQ